MISSAKVNKDDASCQDSVIDIYIYMSESAIAFSWSLWYCIETAALASCSFQGNIHDMAYLGGHRAMAPFWQKITVWKNVKTWYGPFVWALVASENLAPLWNPKYATAFIIVTLSLKTLLNSRYKYLPGLISYRYPRSSWQACARCWIFNGMVAEHPRSLPLTFSKHIHPSYPAYLNPPLLFSNINILCLYL